MYHAKYIVPVLAVVVIAFAAPFWMSWLSPAYEYPEVAKPTEWKTCIESAEWMRANHMSLLNTWRDQVVREGRRAYKGTDGRYWTASLQETCMGCHVNKAAFCDSCHENNSVAPYCWDCHIEPRGNR